MNWGNMREWIEGIISLSVKSVASYFEDMCTGVHFFRKSALRGPGVFIKISSKSTF